MSAIPSTPWERAELGRELRRSGLSYSEIAEIVPAAKATIAGWCRGIELTPEQRRAIIERTGSRAGVPVDTQHRRRLEIERIRSDARSEVASLLTEPMWIAGTMLYWSEGSKSSNRLCVTNADVDLIRLFMGWVRVFIEAEPGFRAQLSIHHANDEPAARRWWADELSLSDAVFLKSFVKPPGTGHRKNHLAHGVCQLRVSRSADHLHRVGGWIDGLRELSATVEY